MYSGKFDGIDLILVFFFQFELWRCSDFVHLIYVTLYWCKEVCGTPYKKIKPPLTEEVMNT